MDVAPDLPRAEDAVLHQFAKLRIQKRSIAIILSNVVLCEVIHSSYLLQVVSVDYPNLNVPERTLS
jgi:hypothetical protein